MIEEDIEKNLELVKKSQNKVIEDASKIKKLQSNLTSLMKFYQELKKTRKEYDSMRRKDDGRKDGANREDEPKDVIDEITSKLFVHITY